MKLALPTAVLLVFSIAAGSGCGRERLDPAVIRLDDRWNEAMDPDCGICGHYDRSYDLDNLCSTSLSAWARIVGCAEYLLEMTTLARDHRDPEIRGLLRGRLREAGTAVRVRCGGTLPCNVFIVDPDILASNTPSKGFPVGQTPTLVTYLPKTRIGIVVRGEQTAVDVVDLSMESGDLLYLLSDSTPIGVGDAPCDLGASGQVVQMPRGTGSEIILRSTSGHIRSLVCEGKSADASYSMPSCSSNGLLAFVVQESTRAAWVHIARVEPAQGTGPLVLDCGPTPSGNASTETAPSWDDGGKRLAWLRGGTESGLWVAEVSATDGVPSLPSAERLGQVSATSASTTMDASSAWRHGDVWATAAGRLVRCRVLDGVTNKCSPVIISSNSRQSSLQLRGLTAGPDGALVAVLAGTQDRLVLLHPEDGVDGGATSVTLQVLGTRSQLGRGSWDSRRKVWLFGGSDRARSGPLPVASTLTAFNAVPSSAQSHVFGAFWLFSLLILVFAHVAVGWFAPQVPSRVWFTGILLIPMIFAAWPMESPPHAGTAACLGLGWGPAMFVCVVVCCLGFDRPYAVLGRLASWEDVGRMGRAMRWLRRLPLLSLVLPVVSVGLGLDHTGLLLASLLAGAAVGFDAVLVGLGRPVFRTLDRLVSAFFVIGIAWFFPLTALLPLLELIFPERIR